MAVGKRSTTTVSCGRDLDCVVDLQHELHSASSAGFDFVCVPIVHPRYEQKMIKPGMVRRNSPLTRSDLTLTSSAVIHIRKEADKVFFQEFSQSRARV